MNSSYKHQISVDKSLSVASKIIHEPVSPKSSIQFYRVYEAKEYNDGVGRLNRMLDKYRLGRVDNAIHNPDATFVSSNGKPYKLLGLNTRRRFPSEYLATNSRPPIPPASLYSYGRHSLYFQPI